MPSLLVTGNSIKKLEITSLVVKNWDWVDCIYHSLLSFLTLVLRWTWGDFLIINPTRCTNFSNLFWNETLHVSDSSSVHHQGLFTVHSAMVYVIKVCRQLSNRIRIEMQFHPDPAARLGGKSISQNPVDRRWGPGRTPAPLFMSRSRDGH
jgi:hypothetical protein